MFDSLSKSFPLYKPLSAPRIKKNFGVIVQKTSLWVGMAILSGCTLGSQNHNKKYLATEKFIDLNSVPFPCPHAVEKNQACRTYKNRLEWLQQEHHTLEAAVQEQEETPE